MDIKAQLFQKKLKECEKSGHLDKSRTVCPGHNVPQCTCCWTECPLKNTNVDRMPANRGIFSVVGFFMGSFGTGTVEICGI